MERLDHVTADGISWSVYRTRIIVGRGLIKVGDLGNILRDLFNRKIFKTLFYYSYLRSAARRN